MQECVKILFTWHLAFTHTKNKFIPFTVIKLRLLILLFGFITASLTSPAQQLVRDTVVVLPGFNNTLFFERRDDGDIYKKDSVTFVIALKKDTQARTWLFINEYLNTPPFLFEDCIYINPLLQTAKGQRPEFFLQKKSFNDQYDHLKWFKSERSSEYRIPVSSRYYIDSSYLQHYPNGLLWSDTVTSKIATQYVSPFYFRKTEVTNAEYREFIHWVMDSITHTRLKHFNADGSLNWKIKIDYADSAVRNKTGMYLPLHMRYWARAEIDTRQLVYKFRNSPHELGADTVAVYPDTLAWVHDFRYSYNEPMSNMYFWHPANNDYPVSGVSYWQCLAYLDWLTVKLNKKYAKQGLKVSCQLPSAAEWDMVSTAQTANGKPVLFGNNYNFLCDDAWITDLTTHTRNTGKTLLYVREGEHLDTFSLDKVYTLSHFRFPMYYSDALRKQLNQQSYFPGNFVIDNAFHTQPVNAEIPHKYYSLEQSRKKINEQQRNPYFTIHLDSNGVSYLDGNVSEWLREDVNTCWRPMMEKRLNYWSPVMTAEDSIVRSIETYYYRQLPANGKLVMGGNWFDERYSFVFGKNAAGYNAKTFLDPVEKHCTVGFRYVIYVTPAEKPSTSK
jgi:formylglycine-generating enzyme required for sulfatase activity